LQKLNSWKILIFKMNKLIMKSIFTFWLFLVFLYTQAGDTLTRAQVYNFNVGDTFDYRHYNHTITFYPNPSNDSTISYSRYIIAAVYYSVDSNTRYIQRHELYPNSSIYDTLVLDRISEYEVLLDTPNCGAPTTIVSNSQYNGRLVNILGPNPVACFGPSFNEDVFADGLGIVLSYGWGGAMIEGENYWDSLELVYYAMDTETWGTPYYNFPSGLAPSVATNNEITLLPTVNDGTFKVAFPDGTMVPTNFAVYDMSGRCLKQFFLTAITNQVNLGDCSDGVYIWKASTHLETTQTGKLIVR
jgi:hypothetical protein